MKKFIIKVEQNGGEYYGFTTIKGNVIEPIDVHTVVVDGVEIKFDEYIDNIRTEIL